MAIHLRKFHDDQRQVERAVSAAEAAASAGALAARDARRDGELAEARLRARAARDFEDGGEADWRLNMLAKDERERAQLRFELALRQRRQTLAEINRQAN
jgi:hypothetical protein